MNEQQAILFAVDFKRKRLIQKIDLNKKLGKREEMVLRVLKREEKAS